MPTKAAVAKTIARTRREARWWSDALERAALLPEGRERRRKVEQASRRLRALADRLLHLGGLEEKPC